ncbi:hypothetical protein [Caballeronia sp. BR00000012568055]|uniref:hypothetical protein n=1 Tax=Caballeronia sp. BR00000012568055 TaxID=2918761 RepID=UPI0023F70C24|nr:hypothetical protein [Caballeronia sp. BR00000012568055]
MGQAFYYDYNDAWQVIHAWGDGGLHDYRFIYHDALRETEVIDSRGHISLVRFDENNLPISEIDPLGGVTLADGSKTQVSFDQYSIPVDIRDAQGRCWNTDANQSYRRMGRPRSVARACECSQCKPDGNSLTINYDGDAFDFCILTILNVPKVARSSNVLHI